MLYTVYKNIYVAKGAGINVWTDEDKISPK